MERATGIVAACVVAVGCSGAVSDDGESIGRVEEGLNGALSANCNLTRKTFSEPSELLRQQDTIQYYNRVFVSEDGFGGGAISSALPTLNAFIAHYGFEGAETKAFYYNRGDLGIGREMHCVDRINAADQQVACYVKNFAAGDDGSEFTFGLSSDIAFKNLAAGHAFATVAMVYRNLAQPENKVFFVVYIAVGNLLNVV